MATPQHKNPCPGGHEMYNSGRPFFGALVRLKGFKVFEILNISFTEELLLLQGTNVWLAMSPIGLLFQIKYKFSQTAQS